MFEVRGRRFLVVGLGETGVAVAKTLIERGASVRVTDAKSASELGPKTTEMSNLGVDLVLGGHLISCLEGMDFVVVSPGVRKEIELLKEARVRGLKILGEVDLAYLLAPRPVCAVTGTNGKGTTVFLTAHLLQEAGIKCTVAGNDTDRVLIETMLSEPPEVLIVAEISSYQLEEASEFRATVSCVLNIKPEHADHHASFEEYAEAKARLVELTDPKGITVLNADDPVVAGFASRAKGEVLWFSSSGKEWATARALDGYIEINTSKRSGRISLEGFKLAGRHNVENALAASLLALYCGAPLEAIEHGFKTFSDLPHRLELVGEFRGVKFVNDSKATNPFAVMAALEAMEGPVLLLSGGRSKGADFLPMAERAKGKVRKVFVFGEARKELRSAFEGAGVEFEEFEDLPTAFLKATLEAQPGEVVLLSPGCSSLDAYPDYRKRGEEFKWLFQKLVEERCMGRT